MRKGVTHPNFQERIDQETGYRTNSMLVVPLRHTDGSVIGVLQVDKCGGNRSEAARVLEIGRNTLNRKLGFDAG